MDLDDLGNVVALRSTEHVALELASQSADGAPEQFCKLLLPYMLQVMQLTERSSQTLPIVDQHFSRRYPINGPAHELDDALLRGAVTALHKLVAANAEANTTDLRVFGLHKVVTWGFARLPGGGLG